MSAPRLPDPVRLVVVNTVALNTGDAAILLGMVVAFRHAFGPDVQIEIAPDQPEAVRELYPDLNIVAGFDARRRGEKSLAASLRRRRISIAIRLLRRAPGLARWVMGRRGRAHLDRLTSAHAVISAGGTFFVEQYPMRRRAEELLAADLVGTPTFLYTQSLGPFERRSNRRIMRRVVSGTRRTFLRDRRSFEHLVDLGIDPERLSIRPDAAFLLTRRDPEGPPLDGTTRSQGLGQLRRVAISVRPWHHFGDRPHEEGLELYRRSVAAVARRLHQSGVEVVFLSTCQSIAAYWADDSRFARALVDDYLPDLTDVRVDTTFRRPEALRDELAGFDLVVATRMHSAILAMCAGVPVVPIAYQFKTRELFTQLGMESLVSDITTLTPEALVTKVEQAADSLGDLRARVVKATAEFAPAAAQPAHMIRDALFPPNGKAGT